MGFDGTGRLATLASAELTYEQPGATRDPVLPTGYGYVNRDVSIGHGRQSFDRAVDGLVGWQMHLSAGA